ncbi:hypothetical protein [Streptomyces sp. NPDC007346]|uniref:hypothetical protein n=1 Tax=Streptomyces sp. NPDC007346 TaxID=3154682 RepID=UPI0034530DB2
MTFADLTWGLLEVLFYTALIFAPGLLVAADYRHEQPLLDDVAHIVNTYADRIKPLYGKGES